MVVVPYFKTKAMSKVAATNLSTFMVTPMLVCRPNQGIRKIVAAVSPAIPRLREYRSAAAKVPK
jgi:hypothetical protein